MLLEMKRCFTDKNFFPTIMLGICPSLAVATTLENGLAIGVATAAVLVVSNAVVSMGRAIISDRITTITYLVITAALVVITECIFDAYFPILRNALGIYIPVIAVNCLVLYRAEAFAAKNKVIHSVVDGIGVGIVYVVTLCIISGIREIIGLNTFGGIPVVAHCSKPISIAAMAPGGFFTAALLLGFISYIRTRKKKA